MDPVWFTNVLMKYFTTIGMPRNENYPKNTSASAATRRPQRRRGDLLCWDDIKIFRDKWPGILMIKGINRPDDAVKAMDYGVDGINVEPWRTASWTCRRPRSTPDIADAVGDRAAYSTRAQGRGSDIAKGAGAPRRCC